MESFQFINTIVRLLLGAAASLFAILNWPRNRDIAWLFIIIGTLTLYISSVFGIITSMKVIIPEFLTVGNFSYFEILNIIIHNLPFILFAIGFIILLRRKI
ncbi:MAG: hypothetical protein JW904_00505 [Spirochaetales bacterium]|nr:hypothetical protein [Spirochaetales bacterium]